MAPGGKRKRGDRTFSQDSNNDGTNRPSPHRPTNLNLAQQNQQNNSRGGRRSSRGRGGASSPQSPVAPTPNAASAALKTSPTTNSAMSPPPPVGTAQRSLQTINTHTSSSNSKDRPAISPSTPQLPPTISSGYVYEYLTDDKISAWKTTGRKSVMDAAIQSRGNDGYVTLSMIFQELIHAGMEGRIGAVDAGISVKDILANLGPDLEIDASSTFLDTLSILTDSDSYNPTLRQIVFSTGIAATKMREELDAPLLMNLGLVRSSFVRMGTRKATNMLYRQSNYNLLREETEGYSKLMTEYFTSCYCGGYPPTDAPITTNEKVKALIGAFDLDVGRVLDVTLDVFASLLTANFRFFVKFLYTSPWWPESHPFSGLSYTDFGLSPLPSWAHPTSTSWFISDDEKLQLIALREERDCDFWQRVRDVGLRAFFELGGRRIMENQQELLGDPSVAAENKEDQEWISATKTLPPPGNNVAAQLLGFKLRFYTSSARGPRDTLPENLIYLIALLIKIGFISLRDIYPHVHPLDKDMPAHREKLLKEQEERDRKNRPGAANNALANAGALIDDTLPAPSRNRDIEASKTTSKVDPTTEKTGESAEETKKPDIPLPEPVDQKIRLLKSLLLMGALPEALYILGKFPWLMDVYPDLSKHVHRLLHHSLNKVYTRTRPLINRNTIRALVRPAFEQSGLSKGHLGSGDPWSRKVRSHPQIETEELRYYWDEWADTVPICQTVDDVFLLCGTLLNVSGHKIGEDPELMLKLARIGKYSVTEDPSENNRSRWKDLLKRLLVPALSLTKSNPCVVNEVFELLNTYPIMDRYNIYAEWFTGQTSRLADIKRAFEQTKAETKDVLKRISKTNVKPMARALAKVAYSSPGIVFSVALSQIESYDNLIEVVVECARYFTFLAYDVLVWSLVNSLGAQGRNRVQADGMLTSPWLRSLSLFAGKAFKRYKTMNVTPLLRYVGHQLLLGNSVDLEILEQIVTFMTGVRSELAMNDSQIYTMASGEMLQAQTLQALADERHLSGMKSSAKRLMESLSANNLSAQLLILIAQERQQYIFRDQWKDAPLKVVGNNFDKIHQVLYQYLDMLRYLLTPKDFDATVPDLISLISEFGIDPAIAWSIVRPSLSYAIKIMDTASKADEQVNGDVEMGDDSVKSPVGNPKKLEVSSGSKVETSIDLDKEDEQMTDVANIADGGPVSTPTLPSLQTIADDPWHPVLKGLIERLKDILPEGFETTMSLPFYVTFWQLSLHDMTVGKSGYEDELTRIKKGLDFPTNRSDASNRQKVLKKEDLLAKIQAEMKAQIYSFQLVKHRLLREKEHWFASFKSPKEAQAVYAAILQECFFPRILLSAMDAVYTYKLLFWLHNHGTPNFVTMHFIDGMLKEKQLTAMLFTCTARESEHFGMFLNELFKHLARWHAEKKVYEKEAHGVKKELPGFARKLTQGHNPESHMVFEDFRRLLYKWHSGMYRALKACFTGGEYMHIRNAITALKAMSATYPVVNWMGNGLTESIVLLSQTERRQDLKLSATSVLGDLKKREKNWVLPQAFHLVRRISTIVHQRHANSSKSDAAQVRSASRSGSARPSTPQPTSDTAKALNAKAAEFKPKTNMYVSSSYTQLRSLIGI
ncbi:hypothetical protein M501DRAFT_573205 [Patellaria atrata CBS 101060]|uniref:THO complex subunit 2 n=1 Tax=Patellaria atrata CBS 101060 TaxID=1346257 RepID=A0A9P4SEV3_9PEZI|nr:hypothetical protein M501DRAFT_573205 [Patellaria atrata CBS 101060]